MAHEPTAAGARDGRLSPAADAADADAAADAAAAAALARAVARADSNGEEAPAALALGVEIREGVGGGVEASSGTWRLSWVPDAPWTVAEAEEDGDAEEWGVASAVGEGGTGG